MFIRRSFDEFLKLQSEAAPTVGEGRDWVIDWRWLSTPADHDTALPSERSLIDCAAWAKPKKPKHA
jgi:hypothetical protein